MANYIYIKDWEEHQTYRKDRGTPPWIKIHRKLFSCPKWAILSDAEKGQLLSLWILGADNNGRIPNDATMLQKMCQLDKKPSIEKFIKLQLLISDGVNVASSGCQSDAPEAEAEAYRGEAEKKDICAFFEIFWDAYPTNGRRKGSKKRAKDKYERVYQHHEAIMEGVKNYAAYLRATDELNADASTWLNQERWNDDYSYNINGNRPDKSKTERLHDATREGIASIL